MTSSPGIEPGPHWWEASGFTTAPSLLPKQHCINSSGHGNHIVLTFDYHIPRFYALFEYDLHVASPTITLYINKRLQLLYHGFDVEILLTNERHKYLEHWSE